MNKQGMLRSLVRKPTRKPDGVKLTQYDLDRQKEAFFAKGGQITYHDTIVRTVDHVIKGLRGIKTL